VEKAERRVGGMAGGIRWSAESAGSHFQEPLPFPTQTQARAAQEVVRAQSPPPPPPPPLPLSTLDVVGTRGREEAPSTDSVQGRFDTELKTALPVDKGLAPTSGAISDSCNGISGGGGTNSFEREALLLSQELASMQKSLQERMAKYSSVITTEYSLPHV